jgi:hypothetical protein
LHEVDEFLLRVCQETRNDQESQMMTADFYTEEFAAGENEFD